MSMHSSWVYLASSIYGVPNECMPMPIYGEPNSGKFVKLNKEAMPIYGPSNANPVIV